MDQTIAIVLGLTFAQIVTSAQENNETELARLLSNEATQEQTVESLVASPDKVRLALLLSWTKDPPRQLNIVERAELYIGMTEVFGRLRTTTAIPFLIENISLQLPATPNVWTKTAASIEERVPAVAALIAIGPDAAKALISAPRERMASEDRLAATFVISQIGTTPDAREYLLSVVKQGNRLERYWAEEGLKRLDKTRPRN